MMGKTVTEGTCKALNSLDFEIHAKSGTNGSKYDSLNTDMICIAQNTLCTSCIWYYSKDNKKENLIGISQGSDISPTIKTKNLYQDIFTSPLTNFKRPNSVIEMDLDAMSYNEGKIELATLNTPERYRIKSLFDITNTPKIYSDRFTQINPTILTAHLKSNEVNIHFKTLPYQRYTLIRKEYLNNKLIEEKELTTTTNTEESINYIDKDIKNNRKYIYTLNILSHARE